MPNPDLSIPQAVAVSYGVNGLYRVTLSHSAGSRVEIYLHGAHIASWTDSKGEELFFMSSKANFVQGMPIRGGIPVIFPQFGGGALPQHGLVRTMEWKLVHTEVLDGGAIKADFQISDSPDTLALWPYRFSLTLGVLLKSDSLTVSMDIVNDDDKPFTFQAVLHTYFRVADISQTAVSGLEGITFIDTLREDAREVETQPIRFAEETDRVYPGTPNSLKVEDQGNGRVVSIEKRNMPDVVVWNPWIAKSQRMTDFGDEEYLKMVCVETGSIDPKIELLPSKRWAGETTFKVSPTTG